MFPVGNLLVIASLVIVVNRFVSGFLTPLFDKFELDKFWLQYIAWILGGIVIFLSGVNVFAEVLPAYPLVGLVLTALVTGGGANILHDLTDRPEPPTVTNYTITKGYVDVGDQPQADGVTGAAQKAAEAIRTMGKAL
jgi:hypothetical protein